MNIWRFYYDFKTYINDFRNKSLTQKSTVVVPFVRMNLKNHKLGVKLYFFKWKFFIHFSNPSTNGFLLKTKSNFYDIIPSKNVFDINISFLSSKTNSNKMTKCILMICKISIRIIFFIKFRKLL
jgi:hypothetical protein